VLYFTKASKTNLGGDHPDTLSTMNALGPLKGTPEEITAGLHSEKEDEQVHQLASGGTMVVVKRLIGFPGHVEHDASQKTTTFGFFATTGVPGLFARSGVVYTYYEIEVLTTSNSNFAKSSVWLLCAEAWP
jgi:hypothetical protein